MCLAVPGCIESIFQQHDVPMAKVNFGGVLKEVCLVYLPEAKVGDYCLVHVGFAISRIDQQSATETLRTFEEMGILEDELQQIQGEDSQGAFPTQKSCSVNVSQKDSA